MIILLMNLGVQECQSQQKPISSKSEEDGLNPQDRHLAIVWPLPIVEISAKDADRPPIETGYEGFNL